VRIEVIATSFIVVFMVLMVLMVVAECLAPVTDCFCETLFPSVDEY
jgi:hypothetical protein